MASRSVSILLREQFRNNIINRPSAAIPRILFRSASYGDDRIDLEKVKKELTPEIKPPGPEWIDQGWKDDGMGYGDYPNYVEWSYQNRDPNLKYFDQQNMRDFGEPIHVNDDILG